MREKKSEEAVEGAEKETNYKQSRDVAVQGSVDDDDDDNDDVSVCFMVLSITLTMPIENRECIYNHRKWHQKHLLQPEKRASHETATHSQLKWRKNLRESKITVA